MHIVSRWPLGQNKITQYNERILLTEMTERLINNNKNANKLVSVKGKRRNMKGKKGMLQCKRKKYMKGSNKMLY